MSLELVPLCTMDVELGTPHKVPRTPAGDRWIFEVTAGRIGGDRLRAGLKGTANGDWMTVGPGGVGTLDVRSLAETDDGALVFIWYHGRVDLSGGPGAPLFSTPRFESGDERYRWLNPIQAVGKGSYDGTTLHYDVYELR